MSISSRAPTGDLLSEVFKLAAIAGGHTLDPTVPLKKLELNETQKFRLMAAFRRKLLGSGVVIEVDTCFRRSICDLLQLF